MKFRFLEVNKMPVNFRSIISFLLKFVFQEHLIELFSKVEGFLLSFSFGFNESLDKIIDYIALDY